MNLTKQIDRNLEQVEANNQVLTGLLKSSIAKEQNKVIRKQMAERIVNLESRLSTTCRLLIKFLDRTEAYFDNKSEEWLKENISPEDAQDYLDSAKWMADNFGRTNNRIEVIQIWLDNYLPFN